LTLPSPPASEEPCSCCPRAGETIVAHAENTKAKTRHSFFIPSAPFLCSPPESCGIRGEREEIISPMLFQKGLALDRSAVRHDWQALGALGTVIRVRRERGAVQARHQLQEWLDAHRRLVGAHRRLHRCGGSGSRGLIGAKHKPCNRRGEISRCAIFLGDQILRSHQWDIAFARPAAVR